MDWAILRQAAGRAAERSYSPYSHYPVGAAAVTTTGQIITGCNVENASYGLTLCAECGLVSALALSGGGRLAQFCCVDAGGDITMPCGRCRQLLYEHGGAELAMLTPAGEMTLGDILPQAWGPADLEAGHGSL